VAAVRPLVFQYSTAARKGEIPGGSLGRRPRPTALAGRSTKEYYLVRLFDPDPAVRFQVSRFVRWHVGYILVVAGFFSFIYVTGLFKSYFFLRERFIYLFLSPAATALFVLVGPWRRDWFRAIRDMYRRLEGQELLCALAAFVFVFGFFIYGIFIWGLGALVPSLAYM
jgi:hypothetical protein